MKREPKVALLILNWNNRKEICECLESLKNLAYRNYQLIVIDNGSTDGSGQVIEQKYPAIKLIFNPENLGFSGGNNIGIEYALQSGVDYVCLLNNDTVVDRDFLGSLISVAEQEEKIGILGSRVFLYHQPRLLWSEGIKINPKTGRVITPRYRVRAGEAGEAIQTWDAVSGAAMLIKREVLEKVGRLDRNYFIYYEDVDWCWRARKQGYRVVTVPSSRVWHKVSASLKGSAGDIIIYYLVRNQLLLMNKNSPLAFPRRGWRDLEIISFNLAYLLLSSKMNPSAGLKAFWKGIRDFYQHKFGPLPER